MKKEIGLIGVGQAGGNIAHLLSKNGFDTLYLNSSKKDLDTINDKQEKKYHFKNGLGCAKDRAISKDLIKNDIGDILSFIKNNFKNKRCIFLLFSSSGGTGSGACPLLSELITDVLGINVSLITVLPSINDTLKAHINAYECFKEIEALKKIGACFVIDNNKNNDKLYLNDEFVKLFNILFNYSKYNSPKGNIDEMEMLNIFKAKGMSILARSDSDVDIIKKIEDGKVFADIENDTQVSYVLYSGSKFNNNKFVANIGKYIDKYENYNKDFNFIAISGLNLPIKTILELKERVLQDKETLNKRTSSILDDLDLGLTEKEEENSKEIKEDYIANLFAKY